MITIVTECAIYSNLYLGTQKFLSQFQSYSYDCLIPLDTKEATATIHFLWAQRRNIVS